MKTWLKSLFLSFAVKLVEDYLDDAIPYIANTAADQFSVMSKGVISQQEAADLIIQTLDKLRFELLRKLRD